MKIKIKNKKLKQKKELKTLVRRRKEGAHACVGCVRASNVCV